jgi:hypothetical protein
MLVAILGMHRSGTSAVAGMLADHGLEFGQVREHNRFNRRGNREIPELNELHEAILERAGGTWWRPPAEVTVRAGDLRRRNKILGAIEGDPIAVKDPRMLVCRALWSDLELSPIGVIRNPVAVRNSLARRASERPEKHPQLSAREWEDVWVVYNRALLEWHRRGSARVLGPRAGRAVRVLRPRPRERRWGRGLDLGAREPRGPRAVASARRDRVRVTALRQPITRGRLSFRRMSRLEGRRTP